MIDLKKAVKFEIKIFTNLKLSYNKTMRRLS